MFDLAAQRRFTKLCRDYWDYRVKSFRESEQMLKERAAEDGEIRAAQIFNAAFNEMHRHRRSSDDNVTAPGGYRMHTHFHRRKDD